MPTINKIKKHKIKRPTYDYTKLYNNRWTRLRTAYLQSHPLCEMCEKNGIIKPAVEIHHIKPISTGKDELEMRYLCYDYNNLMALCIECHHKIHQQMKKQH